MLPRKTFDSTSSVRDAELTHGRSSRREGSTSECPEGAFEGLGKEARREGSYFEFFYLLSISYFRDQTGTAPPAAAEAVPAQEEVKQAMEITKPAAEENVEMGSGGDDSDFEPEHKTKTKRAVKRGGE